MPGEFSESKFIRISIEAKRIPSSKPLQTSMIKVAVFDEHKGRREAVELLIGLQPDMQCIGVFGDCTNVVDKLNGNPPDVILMDIQMPKVDGIEGIKTLKQHLPSTSIIIQTFYDDDERIFQSLAAGAHGYILKKASNEILIAGIRVVTNGGIPITPSIALRLIDHFGKRATRNKETYKLSKIESDVITELINGLIPKMIAAKLSISVQTVNNHIKNIYEKLHVRSVSEAILVAIQNN